MVETRENKCLFTNSLSLFFTELSKLSCLSTAGFCLCRFENTIKRNYYRVPSFFKLAITVCCYRESVFIFLSLKLNFKKNFKN